MLLVMFANTTLNFANANECNGAPPAKPSLDIKQIASSLDAKADAINAWWTQGRDGMDLSEAIMSRQERIDAVYTELAAERTSLYSNLSCNFTSEKRCASTPGRRRQCPMNEEPPSSKTHFDIAKMQVIGNDFDQSPTLEGRSISYIVKKTGGGSNTGGFKAPVVYLEGAVKAFVDEDIEMVRGYFQHKVTLSNPNNVVVGNNAGKCMNIANDLARLDELHKSAALNETQYQAAVSAALNACK